MRRCGITKMMLMGWVELCEKEMWKRIKNKVKSEKRIRKPEKERNLDLVVLGLQGATWPVLGSQGATWMVLGLRWATWLVLSQCSATQLVLGLQPVLWLRMGYSAGTQSMTVNCWLVLSLWMVQKGTEGYRARNYLVPSLCWECRQYIGYWIWPIYGTPQKAMGGIWSLWFNAVCGQSTADYGVEWNWEALIIFWWDWMIKGKRVSRINRE